MAHLQPIVMLDPELILIFVWPADLLPMGKRSDKLCGVPVVVEHAYAVHDTVPSGRLVGFVCPDLVIETDLWTSPRGIHGEIKTSFPLNEASFGAGADPVLVEKGGKEYRAVHAVHEVKVPWLRSAPCRRLVYGRTYT